MFVTFNGFCDASNSGYGACFYVRSRNEQGNKIIRLVSAKSRVAPLKTITIPRLELCGALLLAQLYHETFSAMGINPSKVIFWCDSTIVLHWIKTPPHQLKMYVANRVTEIRDLSDPNSWRHVGSENNSADAISRGQLPGDFMRNRIWREGPPWLKRDENEWPNRIAHLIEVPELKGNICLTTAVRDLGIFKKYSSYTRLLRIIAYCLRWRADNKGIGALRATEIDNAEMRILKIVQSVSFFKESRNSGVIAIYPKGVELQT